MQLHAQMAAQGAGHHMGHSMASGPDDMQAHIVFMTRRLAGMKTILNARTALEQVLTPEQKDGGRRDYRIPPYVIQQGTDWASPMRDSLGRFLVSALASSVTRLLFPTQF